MAMLVKLVLYSSVFLLLLATPIKCQYEESSFGFFGSLNGPDRQNDKLQQSQQIFPEDNQMATYEERGPDDYFEYEKKVLRARAYMDLLSLTSSVAEEPSSASAYSMIASSHKMANPSAALSYFSPMQSDLSSQSTPFYYYGDQFSWMRPYEFFECDQQP